MKVVAWVTEGGWQAVADAVAGLGTAGDVTFLHVAPAEVAGASEGALSGLMGRRHGPALGERLEAVAGEAAERLLADAVARCGVPGAHGLARTGRAEDVVMDAARDADLLVLARDTRDPGPRSIGHAQRFVVDHAPCAVLLVWGGYVATASSSATGSSPDPSRPA